MWVPKEWHIRATPTIPPTSAWYPSGPAGPNTEIQILVDWGWTTPQAVRFYQNGAYALPTPLNPTVIYYLRLFTVGGILTATIHATADDAINDLNEISYTCPNPWGSFLDWRVRSVLPPPPSTLWTGAIRTIGVGKMFSNFDDALVDANNKLEDSLFLLDKGNYTYSSGSTIVKKAFVRGVGDNYSDVVLTPISDIVLAANDNLILENLTLGEDTDSFYLCLRPTDSDGTTAQINKCFIGGVGTNLYTINADHSSNVYITHSMLHGGYAIFLNSKLDYISLDKVSYNTGPRFTYGCTGNFILEDIALDGNIGYGPDYGSCSLIVQTTGWVPTSMQMMIGNTIAPKIYPNLVSNSKNWAGASGATPPTGWTVLAGGGVGM